MKKTYDSEVAESRLYTFLILNVPILGRVLVTYHIQMLHRRSSMGRGSVFVYR